MPQGVQSLVRLRNFIGCDTETMTPMNTTGTFYEEITGLTLHLHGAGELNQCPRTHAQCSTLYL